MTIFQRLLVGIIAMLMLNTLIGFVGIMSVNKLENNSKIMLKESEEHHRLQRLKLNLLQLLMPPHDYLLHGNKVEIENYEHFDTIIKKQIIECKKHGGVHYNQSFINELEGNFKEIELLSNEIFKLENPIGNTEGAIISEELEAVTNKVLNNLDELLLVESLEMEMYLTTNQETNIMATKVIIIVGLFLAVCLVVGGFFYVKEITKPLKKLSKIAKKVTLGNLSVNTDVKTPTQDEIGDFSKSFNVMIDALKNTTVSRAFFNSIVNRMADTLIITDTFGKISIVNGETIDLLEYTEEELIGQPIEMILSGKSENGVSDPKDKDYILEDNSVQNVYNTYYTKSDKAIPVCFTRSFIRNKKNKITGILHLAFHNSEESHKKSQPVNDNFENTFRNIKTIGDVPLTSRELEIIKLITAEFSNREIAEKLFISVRTVETHRKNIMQKLQTKNVIALVLYAAQNGII